MHPLLRACALALAMLPVAACASLPGGGAAGPLTDSETFRRACAERPNAYAAFLVYDAVSPVSADLRRTVRIANGQITKVCAAPPASIAESAVIVTRALARISNVARRA